jgi:hypothetical protein
VLNDSQTTLDGLYSFILPSRHRKSGPVKSRTAHISATSLGGMIEFPISLPTPPSAFEVERNRERFSEAIKALSVRLGGDEWFLGSR